MKYALTGVQAVLRGRAEPTGHPRTTQLRPVRDGSLRSLSVSRCRSPYFRRHPRHRLVSFLDAALVSEGESTLAQAVAGLRFHGWCGCSQICTYLRTAPVDCVDSAWTTRSLVCGFNWTGVMPRSPGWRSASSTWGQPRCSTLTGLQRWADLAVVPSRPCDRWSGRAVD